MPVKFRIDFYFFIFIKTLNGLAPIYKAELLQPLHNARALRSGQGLLSVPRSRLVTRGGRAFSVLAASAWNRLTAPIRTVCVDRPFINTLMSCVYYCEFCISFSFYLLLPFTCFFLVYIYCSAIAAVLHSVKHFVTHWASCSNILKNFKFDKKM